MGVADGRGSAYEDSHIILVLGQNTINIFLCTLYSSLSHSRALVGSQENGSVKRFGSVKHTHIFSWLIVQGGPEKMSHCWEPKKLRHFVFRN